MRRSPRESLPEDATMHSTRNFGRLRSFILLLTLMAVFICFVPAPVWSGAADVKEEVKQAGAAIAEYSAMAAPACLTSSLTSAAPDQTGAGTKQIKTAINVSNRINERRRPKFRVLCMVASSGNDSRGERRIPSMFFYVFSSHAVHRFTRRRAPPVYSRWWVLIRPVSR